MEKHRATISPCAMGKIEIPLEDRAVSKRHNVSLWTIPMIGIGFPCDREAKKGLEEMKPKNLFPRGEQTIEDAKLRP